MGTATDGIKVWVVVLIVLLAAFGIAVILQFAGYAIMPTFLKQERTIYKSSYQYTEAKEKELLDMVKDYKNLETQKQQYIDANNPEYNTLIDKIDSQQKALEDQIRTEADLVQDKKELPDSVKKFLTEHPE